MSWQIRIVEIPEGRQPEFKDLKPGDGYFLKGLSETELKLRNLTQQYFRENSGRPPFVVMLPGGVPFVVDQMCFSRDRGYYDGWTVSGIPPNITISPSINFEGRYHGFIQNGVIGDDVEGRKFE